MKKIIIKLDKKKLSPKINKISIRWSVSYLKKKINNNIFLKTNKTIIVNCMIIDRDCLNTRNLFYLKNLPIEKESFVIIPVEGKINQAIKDTTISGIAFDVLKTVTMISDEMVWSSGGMCGKKQLIPSLAK